MNTDERFASLLQRMDKFIDSQCDRGSDTLDMGLASFAHNYLVEDFNWRPVLELGKSVIESSLQRMPGVSYVRVGYRLYCYRINVRLKFYFTDNVQLTYTIIHDIVKYLSRLTDDYCIVTFSCNSAHYQYAQKALDRFYIMLPINNIWWKAFNRIIVSRKIDC